LRELDERSYFGLCQAAAWLLRSARYTRVRFDRREGEPLVWKDRSFYAPLLVWLSGPVVRLLDGGVRVLPGRDWQERERRVYRALDRPPVRVDGRGLALPHLPGETLAAVLENQGRDEFDRARAVRLATLALAELHRLGFTHADAMAENVTVDLQAGSAHWFDLETVHDANRSLAWQRADDLRALMFSCAARTSPEGRAATVRLILDTYGDGAVERALAASVTSPFRRSLAFHLSQAVVSFETDRQLARLLVERRRGTAGPV
jgi:hypothetical protein